MKKIFFTVLLTVSALMLKAQWKQVSGIENQLITCMAVSGSNIYAGASANGVFLSVDNGISWQAINTGLPITIVRAIACSGSNVYLGTSDGVFMSSNKGSNWTPITLSVLFDVNALTTIGNSIFAGTSYFGLYVSTDNGKNWKSILGDQNTVIYDLKTYGNTLYVYSSYGLYFTNDNGQNWGNVSPICFESSNAFFLSMAMNGSEVYIGTNKGMYLHTDSAGSWICRDSFFKGTYLTCIEIMNSTVFAATTSGVYVSRDSARTWTLANEGLPYKIITTFVLFDKYIFAGINGGGVWKRPIHELPMDNTPIDTKNTLITLYPNPNNGSFILLSKSKMKTFRLYTTLGELVYSESSFEQGFSIELRLEGLSKGVYFAYIETENGTVNKQICIE